MYSGMLINDLFAMAERAAVNHNRTDGSAVERKAVERNALPRAKAESLDLSSTPGKEAQATSCHGGYSSESEQLPQPFGLSPADWNLGLLLVVHAQLVRALEPRNDFSDSVGIHQVGAVRPPKQIRV